MGKINVAELLKGCPSGMELDCTMYENLYFDSLNADYYGTINCYTLIDGIKTSINFTKYGTFNNHTGSKCVIFPKGKTTWEGFQIPFKDGDVMYNKGINALAIFNKQTDDGTFSHCFLNTLGELRICHYHSKDLSDWKFATEEEKQKLFDSIKANGYKWDPETKSLEKLTELTESSEDVDDRLVMSGIYFDRENYSDEVELHLNKYEIEIRDGKTYAVFKNQETKTDKLIEPKFKVGDRIRRKNSNEEYIITSINDYTYYYRLNEYCTGSLGIQLQDDYELVPDKFDINTLVPFESKVLIRDNVKEKWHPGIWGYYDNDTDSTYPYKLIGVITRYCIPYEGNEHLLGTTNDCNEFYKTWK